MCCLLAGVGRLYRARDRWPDGLLHPRRRPDARRDLRPRPALAVAIAEPVIVAASTHGAEAGEQGAEARLVRTTPSAHGGLAMFAIIYPW